MNKWLFFFAFLLLVTVSSCVLKKQASSPRSAGQVFVGSPILLLNQ